MQSWSAFLLSLQEKGYFSISVDNASLSYQFQVPVTLASQASPPLLAGNTCQNIVSQVRKLKFSS